MTASRYEEPALVGYGKLADITATNGVTEDEDGIGKMINSDGSGGFTP